MTEDNELREYAHRHAYDFARQFVCRDDASAYADWYIIQIQGEDNADYWPGHGYTFDQWRRMTEVRRISDRREETNGDF